MLSIGIMLARGEQSFHIEDFACSTVGELYPMNDRIRFGILLGVGMCMSLAGCVSMYKKPEPSSTTATIEFVDRHSGPGRGHVYFWHTTQTCDERPGEGRIAALDWVNGQKKKSVLLSGARGYLLVQRQVLVGIERQETFLGGAQYVSDVCKRLVSFIPQAGRTYRAEMGDLPACLLSVTDAETGSSIESLEVHEVSGRCTESI